MLVAGALPRARSLFALALAAVVGVALLWALVGVVFPDLGPDVELSARLREPVGYWNALALVFALGIPPALWLAVDAARPAWLRGLAVAGLAGGLVGIALTGSRGGLVAAGIAAVVWVLLSPRRVEGGLALVAAALAAMVVSAIALPLPGIGDAGAALGDRRRDGAVLGLVLVLVLGAVGVLWARGLDRLATGPRRRTTARALVVAGVVVVVAAVAGGSVAAARGGPVCNPPSEQVTQNAGRILETSFNNRCTWWRNAIDVWRHDAGAGTGAGTFELARRPLREDSQQPLAPHDLPLQALAETGLVGFLLLLAAACAAAWVVIRVVRVREAAALALTATLAAWAAHALVDMAWEYPAVTAPAFAALGVLAAEPGARAARRPLAAIAAVALGVVALASVGEPVAGRTAAGRGGSGRGRRPAGRGGPRGRRCALAQPAFRLAARAARGDRGGRAPSRRGAFAAARGRRPPAAQPGHVVRARTALPRRPPRPGDGVLRSRSRLRARQPGSGDERPARGGAAPARRPAPNLPLRLARS